MDYTNSYKRVNIFNPTYMESILYFKHNILNWLLQDYPFQSQYTSIYEEYFMQWKSIQYLLFLFVTMTAWGTQATYVWKVFRKLMGCVYYGKEKLCMDFKNVLNQINLLKFHFHQLFQVPLCLFTCFPFLVNTEVAFGDPNPGNMNYME